jgi:hypothetical protein
MLQYTVSVNNGDKVETKFFFSEYEHLVDARAKRIALDLLATNEEVIVKGSEFCNRHFYNTYKLTING